MLTIDLKVIKTTITIIETTSCYKLCVKEFKRIGKTNDIYFSTKMVVVLHNFPMVVSRKFNLLDK